MSNIVYDVALDVSYNSAYKHYLANYQVGIKPYKHEIIYSYVTASPPYYNVATIAYYYEANVSFDDGKEITITGSQTTQETNPLGQTRVYSNPIKYVNVPVLDAGPFKKVYVRNTQPESVKFNTGNTFFRINYSTKVSFEAQFNSTGFAANQNASFRCSTVQQNSLEQYEWESATVYYKKASDVSYQSAAGVISGTWSNVTVSTDISLEDGYTYNVYITAVADDGSTATTPVADFTTTDTDAIASCISPVGAFTNQEITFVWAHSTSNGTPQYAYDLQYSSNNGASWTTVKNHEVTTSTTTSATISSAGQYIWRVRTYNSNDVVGEWAQGAFVNNAPAEAPRNLSVTTGGRPVVSWSAASQMAYQVQVLSGETIVHDSGAIYTPQTTYIINQYFDDTKAYQVRVRVYNALGEASDWSVTGYQQPSVPDVIFSVENDPKGGASIIISNGDGLNVFEKFYILRNEKPIAETGYGAYYDKYAVGDISYSVIGVTAADQSDIKSEGARIIYPRATIVTLSGETYVVNKRVDETYEVQTSVEKDYNQARYLGDDRPSHYSNKMVAKSFAITCFDKNNTLEKLLGDVVFYADNFGNGGYCFVTSYSKNDSYLEMLDGTYANEVTLSLEVTNYDDSIEYTL